MSEVNTSSKRARHRTTGSRIANRADHRPVGSVDFFYGFFGAGAGDWKGCWLGCYSVTGSIVNFLLYISPTDSLSAAELWVVHGCALFDP